MVLIRLLSRVISWLRLGLGPRVLVLLFYDWGLLLMCGGRDMDGRDVLGAIECD